jgi:pimeloyl-ACP methyl ester carboxylesterase
MLSFLFLGIVATAHAATIAGKEAKPGPLVEIQFPVSTFFQNMAADGGNPRPQTGRAILSFPPGFDPARRWPILIVTSTTDFHRTSPMDAFAYKPVADAEGWVILASDATITPKFDSTPWRLAMLGAALDQMRKDWPQSKNWPVAFAGFSGGAKRSCLLSAMMAKGRAANICGLFLSGINDDRLTVAYRDYHPSAEFLNTPIWISGGMDDPIATPSLEGQVAANMRRTGFRNVRLEHFMGTHQLKRSELKLALRWFRELGRF